MSHRHEAPLCHPTQVPTPPFGTESPAWFAAAKPSPSCEAERLLGPSS